MHPHVGDRDIAAAVAALVAGRLVAFPTETVYGLGASARDPRAVARLYAAKGRPADHPVIVHLASVEDLGRWARQIPAAARALADCFWPGPLTLVLPRAAGVSDAITGGQDSVALRCPAHPVALRLLRAARDAGIDGLVAPSANRFGRVSPTTAAHVRDEFAAEIALVLDGGACEVGIESTIVDLVAGAPRVLRPGMITDAAIADCLGTAPVAAGADAPRVAGALPAHYAPATPLELVASAACPARIRALLAAGLRVGVFARAACLQAVGAADGLLAVVAPPAPAAYARALYASLRELDAGGCARLVVEAPPTDPAWRGIADRLHRAARGRG